MMSFILRSYFIELRINYFRSSLNKLIIKQNRLDLHGYPEECYGSKIFKSSKGSNLP